MMILTNDLTPRVATVLLFPLLVLSSHGIEVAGRQSPSQSDSSARQSGVDDRCGITKSSVVFRRIVGGRKALRDEFPYQVALEHRSFWNPSYRQFCGGSVIADRWIVTAAHCVTGENVSFMRAVAGVTELRDSNSNVIDVEKIIRHERYNSWTVENDIALIKTKNSIRSASRGYVNSICLPSPAQDFTGVGVITGFGLTKEGGSQSRSLMAAPLDIQPDSACTSAYSNEYKAPGMLCAGDMSGRRDSCQGDSGGPLAVKSDSRYTLIGITSFGRGCARANTPGVYTRVSRFVDWIEQQIRSN